MRKTGGSEPSWQEFSDFFDTLRKSEDPRVLLKGLLTGLVTLMEAERGFVLLYDEIDERMLPVTSFELEDADEFVALSSTVYERALNEESLLYIHNSHEDVTLSNAPSIVGSLQPLTIFCAALSSGGKAFGVLYLDKRATAIEPSAEKISFLSSIAGLVGQLLAANEARHHLIAARARSSVFDSILWQENELVFGEGAAAKELKRMLDKAAPADVTVMITGETGTGKEVVARAIHRMSNRRNDPFIPVNCAALPQELIEAELFGAEKGAFTGANEKRIGRFELAGSGTLFLDELGDLPLDVQLKLLRVLQERTVTRLGGNEPIRLRFRLLCATNVDLEEAVRQGTFRQDLYYRVNVFPFCLRPLRERTEDIIPLATHFMREFGAKFGRSLTGFSIEAKHALCCHDWPGNIRELRNVIERAALLAEKEMITLKDLPFAPSTDDSELEGRNFWAQLPANYEAAREVFEQTFLERSMQFHLGNISAIAKATGMPRSTIYRRLKKLGLITD